MSPENQEQGLAEKEQEINGLFAKRAHEQISPIEFAHTALTLAAERGDIQFNNSSLVYELGVAESQDVVREASARGSHADLSGGRFPEETKEVDTVSDLIAHHVDPKICYRPFIRRSVRPADAQQTHSIERWNRRDGDMREAGLSDKQRAVLYADMLAQEAGNRLTALGKGVLDPSLKADTINWPHKLGSIKFNDEGVLFSEEVYKRVKGIVRRIAKDIDAFGEEGDRAMDIAAAVNYLITSEYKGRDLSAFRRSVYSALKGENGKPNCDQAVSLIREKMQSNRNAFTSKAQRNFGASQ